MISRTARRLTLAIAVAAALTSVAACSSAETPGRGDKASGHEGGAVPGSTLAALRTVAMTTDKAESAKVESTTTMGTMMSMTADGTLGWVDGLRGTLTITYTGGQMADTMRQLGSTATEARYLPDAYYAKMGATFASKTGGKHWIKYAYQALADLTGGSGAYLPDQMQNTTPNQSVKLLLASGDVKKVGEETVRGAAATHYSGTVDVAELAGVRSSLSDDQLADMKQQLEQAGITSETVDVWVDDRDLLVKRTERAETANGAMTYTAYYSDYGTPVSVEEPPAGDTADFRDLVSGSQGTEP